MDNRKTNKIIISIVTHNSRDIFKTLDHLEKEIGEDPRFEVKIFDNNLSLSSQPMKILDLVMDTINY